MIIIRLPSRVKAEEKMAKCTVCGQEIRVTKTNTEHKTHFENRHATSTFASCFPGIFDPTIVVAAEKVDTAGGGSTTTVAAEVAKPKKKKEDLSFLDAALDPKAGKKK
jgi:hypothetical protein